MNAEKKVLVLGVGNLLLGDEGIGVHIAQHLQHLPLPANVDVVDGATGGFELLEHVLGKNKVIVVDAIDAPASAGTVVRLNPEDVRRELSPLSFHQSGIHELLHYCSRYLPETEIVILGAVPERIDTPGIGLSESMKNSMEKLIAVVLQEATVAASSITS
ncbi:MAG TPA: hydrogenase maturation protease [Bacteroidota bacterium]|nr:hydrogenase maturation protease [Bacteroidota bacterium]